MLGRYWHTYPTDYEAEMLQFYRLAKAKGYETAWSGAGERAYSASVKCTDRQWEQLRADARAQWERAYAIA